MGLPTTQGVVLTGRPMNRFRALGSLYASLANNQFGPVDANGMMLAPGIDILLDLWTHKSSGIEVL